MAGLRFCPSCGLDSAELGDHSAAPLNDGADPTGDAVGSSFDGGPPTGTRPDTPTKNDARPDRADSSTAPRRVGDRGPRGPSIVVGALIVAAGLVIFGLLTRPQPGAAPAALPDGQAAPGGPSVAPSALIVGLTIQSPGDGQVIATKEVTVIGLAPPGLTITRDVSLGLDQHATADGTGHWAINVGLDNGENKLKFRIGDDRSTEQEIRVTYTPQAP